MANETPGVESTTQGQNKTRAVDLNSSPQPKNDLRGHLELFNVYRDYVKHEDNLINYRTNWMITVQSFIIATFGFSFMKHYEFSANTSVMRGLPEGRIEYLLVGLSIIGLLVALISYWSIKAAARALDGLKAHWERIPREHWSAATLPSLTGGDQETAHKEGYSFALALPLLFILWWTVAFFYVLLDQS